MKRIKTKIIRKLHQESGASITFALLLFLICSVVCSVVLTAATAASGRMSRTAINDQRYYAVTSAAELVRGMLDDHTVSVAQVTTATQTTAYTNGVAGAPVDNQDTKIRTYLLEGKTAPEVSEEDLTVASQTDGDDANGITANELISSSIASDASYKCFNHQTIPGSEVGSPRELSLTVSSDSGTGLGKAELDVTVEETLDGSGNLILLLYNTQDADGRYTLKMDFAPDIRTTSSTASTDGPRENMTGSGETVSYTVTTVKTETVITSYRWHLISISTVTQ